MTPPTHLVFAVGALLFTLSIGAAPRTAIACNNENIELDCPTGALIDPTTAIYGRTDNTSGICGSAPVDDCVSMNGVVVKVEAACKGANSCSFPASDEGLGDPCPFVRKYLNVSYECVVPVRAGRFATTTACENTQLVLRCKKGAVIDMVRASYGRQNTTTESCGFPDSGVTDCSLPGAGDLVSTMCRGLRKCTIPEVTNEVMGSDPCPGVKKVLEAQYTCASELPDDNAVCETETVQLTCPNKTVIEMTSSTYGRSQEIPNCPPGNIDNLSCGREDNVLSVLEQLCNGQSACDVEVSNEFFGIGDPCQTFRKYLNYTFDCVDAVRRKCGKLFDDGATAACFRTRLPRLQTSVGNSWLRIVSVRGKFRLVFTAEKKDSYFKKIKAGMFMFDKGILSAKELRDCCSEDLYIYAFAVVCDVADVCRPSKVIRATARYKCKTSCPAGISPYGAGKKCPSCRSRRSTTGG